uniref:SFRICE_020462 n=1 Tax=Spodoptera frugiperda TaxID=7108 RepID=A0A2H1WA83_SPOFR
MERAAPAGVGVQRGVRAGPGQAVRGGRELLLALLQLHAVRGAHAAASDTCRARRSLILYPRSKQIRSPDKETACEECPLGTLPGAGRTHCAAVPELYLRPDSPAAIGAMAFSSLGMLLTTLVAAVWAVRGDTPVVRASGRELSFVLLAGIMMCYLVTFALVFRPTDVLCSLQRILESKLLAALCDRFGTGFCFTVVYAALLTKTNRIARIFDASKHSARRPSLISPKSQLFICSVLVSIQVVIVVVWQIISPARAIHHYPSREDNMLVCDSYVDASYTIAFFYPVVLIVVCTVYAVLTRKIPEAFNESKHIGAILTSHVEDNI